MPRIVKYLGATITRDRAYHLAILPRQHGEGRIRKTFRTVPEAKRWIDENITAARMPHKGQLTPAQQEEYHAAVAMLPDGHTIKDACTHYAATLRAAPTLADAPTVADAVAQYIKAKRANGRRQKTLEGYAHCLKRLPQFVRVSQLTTQHLEASLVGLGSRDGNNHIGAWSTFFNWCAVPARGWVASNPAKGIEKHTGDLALPPIYTPAEMRKILTTASKTAPDLVPLLAIAAFAGVRTAGLLRLRAGDVDVRKGIVWVGGYADKNRRSYTVKMTPNLKKWLRKYPFKPMPVTPAHFCNRRASIYKEGGIEGKQNGFRHSFGTYLLGLTDDAPFVASQLGQFGGIGTLLNSYRRATTEATAKRYFAISPP